MTGLMLDKVAIVTGGASGIPPVLNRGIQFQITCPRHRTCPANESTSGDHSDGLK